MEQCIIPWCYTVVVCAEKDILEAINHVWDYFSITHNLCLNLNINLEWNVNLFA